MIRRNKFNAKKTVVDGLTFDSKREAAYYAELKLRERAGEISKLRCHECFPLIGFEGVKICLFKPDFNYFDIHEDRYRVVDVKSPPTAKKADFRLKKKLFEAQYGVELEIVF